MTSLVSPPIPPASHEPSENWDDDFEFNPSTAKNTPRRPTQKPQHGGYNDNRKHSVASSVLEDWDAEPSTSHALGAAGEQETENWDDDYEDTRGSPRKPLTMRAPSRGLGEENWDEEEEEEEEEEDENTADFGVFGDKDEDRTVTAKSRRAALSRLASDIPPPPPLPTAPPTSMSSLGRPFSQYSPSSSVFSVPTTIHTYTSTTHLRPTSAFALLPPSPPIHRERERRRLKKKSRPRPQGVFELGTIPAGVPHPHENRFSFSDDGDASGNEMTADVRGETPKSDHDSASSVEQTPPPLPQLPNPTSSPSPPATTSKGGALLSRIGSVKRRWEARRRGNSTTPADLVSDANGRAEHVPRPQSSMSSLYNSASSQRNSIPNVPSSPPPSSSNWFFRASSAGPGPSSPRRASVKSDHRAPFPSLPTAPSTPTHRRSSLKKSRRSTSRSRGGAGDAVPPPQPEPVEPTRRRERRIERVDTRSPPSTQGIVPPPLPASSSTTTPTKLIKRKSLGFVHLGRSRPFGGHSGTGHNDDNSPAHQDEYGKTWVSRYAGLGIGRAGPREPEEPGAEEERPRRRSISRLLSSDSHHDPPTTTPSNTPPSKEGSRFLMGSMRRLSLVSSRHKRTKSGSGVAPLALSNPSRDSVTSPPLPIGRQSNVPPSLPPLPKSMSQISLSLRVPSEGSGTDSLVPPSTEPSTAGSRQTSGSSSKTGLDDIDDVPPVPPVPPELQSPPIIQRSNSKLSRKSRKSSEGRQRSVSQSRSASASGHSTSRKSSFERDLSHTTPTAATREQREREQDREPKTPSRLPPTLLPPIELHPPSPPETVTKPKPRSNTVSSGVSLGDRDGAVQRLVFEALSPSLSLSSAASTSNSGFFTPLSASPKHGVTQAASLGRSTPIKPSLDGGPSAASLGVGLGSASGSGMGISALGGETPVARRNSLGDLKIPARISQAQVGLRRDLGMVREFAAHIQQLKDIQVTHTQLVAEVQSLLDTHAAQHARETGVQVEPVDFASILASPAAQYPVSSPPPSATSSSQPATKAQAAYRDLALGFYSISARYRVSWECAELLVELAGGRDKDEPEEPPERRNVSAPNPAPLQESASLPSSVFSGKDDVADFATPTKPAAKPPSPSTSTRTPPSTQSSSSWKSSTGRSDLSHRQLALLREMLNHGPDENSEGDMMQHLSIPEDSLPPEPHSPLLSSPPHAQPLSAASTATTTTADASSPITDQGLRAISNLPAAWGSVSQLHLHHGMGLAFPLVTQHSTSGAGGSRDVSGTGSAMGTITGPNPTSGTGITPAQLALGMTVNRDWRWGDARSSTITLPSEEGGGVTAFSGGGAESGGAGGGGKSRRDRTDRERKRRSGRLAGMIGIRDMLRALKKGKDAENNGGTRPGSASGSARGSMGRAAFASLSTTSLATDTAHGGGPLSRSGHRIPHPRVTSGSRRKSKVSTGPESIGFANGGSIGVASAASHQQGPSPPFQHPPKPSPRRPSLASIFRIGNKNRPTSTIIQGDSDATQSPLPSNPPPFEPSSVTDDPSSYPPRSTSTTTLGSSSSDLDGDPSFEEDWDRMDSASDLDAAAKALKVKDGSSTVRLKKRTAPKNRGRSPYLQLQLQGQGGIFDPPASAEGAAAGTAGGGDVGVTIPTSSSSSVKPSIIQKRSFNTSRTSLYIAEGTGQAGTSSSGNCTAGPVPNTAMSTTSLTARPPRLSNVDEHPVALAAQQQLIASTSPSQPRSSKSPSRPSSSRSNKPPPFGPVHAPGTAGSSLKTGSVRSAAGPVLAPSSSSSTGLAMTPENIKPLLENAKVVLARLIDCIEEIRSLLAEVGSDGAAVDVPEAIPASSPEDPF